MSRAIHLLLCAFVDWKVATLPFLLFTYRFRYLEDWTLWHEWLLVLTATTATGQPLLSNNASGLRYVPLFEFRFSPIFSQCSTWLTKAWEYVTTFSDYFNRNSELRLSYLTLGVFLTCCCSVSCALHHFVCTYFVQICSRVLGVAGAKQCIPFYFQKMCTLSGTDVN